MSRSELIETHRARFAAMVPDALPRLFARLYDAPFYRGMHRQWMATLPLSEGQSAVDVGCGPGGLTTELASRGLRVTGIDRAADMLDVARELAHSAGADATFVVGDATALPCAKHSFDLALCSSLLNVLDDASTAFRELTRAVRPGGIVSVLVPDPSMTKDAALAHADANELPADDAALLLLWAGVAPKTSAAQAAAWFQDAGLAAPEHHRVLAGMAHVTTATTAA